MPRRIWWTFYHFIFWFYEHLNFLEGCALLLHYEVIDLDAGQFIEFIEFHDFAFWLKFDLKFACALYIFIAIILLRSVLLSLNEWEKSLSLFS